MYVSKWSLPVLLMTTVLSIPSFSATPDRIAGAIDSSHGVALQKSLHPKAQAKYDEGSVEASFQLNSITLLFSPSPAQQKALDQLVAEQQDPKSSNYHKWLTPSQYAQRFGLSPNDLAKITAWLQSEGFTIQTIGAGHNRLVFSGTAASVQSAFKAEIHRYNVDGVEHFANADSIMVPVALEGIVSGIIGVNDFRWRSASRLRIGSSFGPHANYYGGSGTNTAFENFLAPADVNTIYDIPSSLTGSGQTIAIIGETDVFINDINDFRSAFGLTAINTSNCTFSTMTTPGVITACNDPHFKYILVLPTGGTDPQKPDSVQSGDIGEADLDLEWSGAVAPGAQIVFINAPDPTGNGVFDSLTYAIDTNPVPAHVVSMSYGNCEAESVLFESMLEQAVTEGITVVNSAGDSGAAACDDNPPNANPPYDGAENGLAVNYPASSIYVVAAGGTGISLADDSFPSPATNYWNTSNGTNGTEGYGGTAKSYIPELAWNDDVLFAQLCTETSDPSENTFCNPPAANPPEPGVLITSAQTAQEDYWISASGGGGSNCATENGTTCVSGFSQPSWQSGLTVSGAPSGVRWVPDIALLASPDFPGYIYCTPEKPDATTPNYASTCASGIATAVSNSSIVGGTSASSPIFAAMVGLLNQSLNTPSGSGLGDIHKTLYTLAATPSNGAFHQVTSGSNMVYCVPGTPSTQPAAIQCPAGASDGPIGYEASNAESTTGYNLVTGLGSVDVGKLVTAWAAATQAQFSLSAGSINPTSVQAGGSPLTATITVAPNSGSNFTGTVSFSCPSSVTCSFNPTTVSGGSGTTTVTISVAANVAAGPDSVTVTGTSGSVSATTTVGFTVTASNESFTFTSNLASGTLSVKQGATGNVNLTINSTNGFTTTSGGNTTTVLPLSYVCSGYPSLSTCTFSPVSPNQSTAVTVNIATIASTSAQARPLDHGTRIFYAALLPGFFGIMLVAGSRRRSLGGMRMLGLILVLGASTLWLGSCGGSNNSSTGTQGTAPGNYTITVNASTGGSAPITSSYHFTLTVTQ
jgi:subtilase family serine protease